MFDGAKVYEKKEAYKHRLKKGKEAEGKGKKTKKTPVKERFLAERKGKITVCYGLCGSHP